MEFQVRVKPKVQKEISNLPKAEYYKVLTAFSMLSQNPFQGKKLKGELCHCYTYRVWPYRIIYEVHKHELVILIIRVGHRQGIYK